LGVLLDRFDDFWVGTYLGSRSLGYYSRAYALAQYPERIIATPIVNVFFPTYAAVQNNKTELSKAFFRSSSFLIRTGFLFALVLMITAPEITLILFTATWLPIVPIFRIMVVYILLDPFYVNLSYLLAGIGQPGVLTRTRIIQTAFFVVAVISFAYLWGVKGVAVAANLMMFIGTIILVVKIRQFVSFSLTRMLRWPIVAFLLASIAGLITLHYSENLNIWSSLFLKGSVVTIVYLLTLYLTERKVFHEYGTLILQPLWNQMKSLLP
jgi:PST family polysaccharide transporter